MTLVDQCEDLFAYLCLLNHLGRQYELDPSVIREKALLRRKREVRSWNICARSRMMPPDSHVYNRNIEIALWATADWMIDRCRLPLATRWDKKGFDPNGSREQTLDELFWDSLGATLGEAENDASDQRLAVFASCLGLGFIGKYFDDSKPLDTPDVVRQEMRPRLVPYQGKYEREKTGRVTPKA